MAEMTISNQGIELIKRHESLRLNAYLCPAGKWTIGWGHTRNVSRGQRITRAEAERLLADDLRPGERLLNTMGISFGQGQFDALASWIFNLGTGRFASSTLCKRLQAGATGESITDQMVKWIYSKGKPLAGLMKRRTAEANMYLGRERYRVVDNKIMKV